MALRKRVGQAAIEFCATSNYPVLVIAVAKVHMHLLVELPKELRTVKKMAGDLKRATSRAIKHEMPGTVWARGGTYKPVRSVEHHREVFWYILTKQGRFAWTWMFKDGSDDGKFGRAK